MTGITINDAFHGYLRTVQGRLRPRTLYETKRLFARDIQPSLGHRPLGALKRSEVIDLHRSIAQHAPIVANRAVSILAQVLEWGRDRDLTQTNVAHRVRRSLEEPRETTASVAELERLFMVLPATVAGQAIIFVMLSGCRRSEALSLKWSHLDFVVRSWTKPASLAKSKRTTTIPLSSGTLACLPPVTSVMVFPTTSETMRRTWERARAAAGLKALRTHDLRRTHLTRLIENGVPPAIAAASVGSRDPKVVLRHYTRISLPVMHAALAQPTG